MTSKQLLTGGIVLSLEADVGDLSSTTRGRPNLRGNARSERSSGCNIFDVSNRRGRRTHEQNAVQKRGEPQDGSEGRAFPSRV